MSFQLLLTLISYLHWALPVLAIPPSPLAQELPISNSSSSCPDHCGDILIPFPFGTREDCYRNDSFWVTCNHTVRKPSKLFWRDTTIEITRISLDGQMTVMHEIYYNCIGSNETLINSSEEIDLPDFFVVSNTANNFTVIGCDSFGFIYGGQAKWPPPPGQGRTPLIRGSRYGKLNESSDYSTGCTASCPEAGGLIEGSCSTGTGCCQTTLPKNIKEVSVEVSSYNNYSRGIRNCTYGFLLEATETRKINSNQLANLVKDNEKLPMVLDWAIWNTTASDFRSACKSVNSFAVVPENGYGYKCKCTKGYDGNPYLDDGCQDINECKPGPDQNYPCQHNIPCKNIPGGFECPCPKGYEGDGRLDQPGCSRPSEPRTLKLVAGTSLGIVLLLLIACLAYLEHNRRQLKREKRKFFHQNGGDLLLQKFPLGSRDALKIFKISELKRATNDFHEKNIVGRGGFGIVYRGILSNDHIVAIKKSKSIDQDQIEQFVNEMVVLSQTNHRNIVKLLGCCLETEVPYLVYEFIRNGTLSKHLYDPNHVGSLNWESRLRIAAETAGVLAYLHSAASDPIIHRDVKSDNILLDDTFTAKVSDFGASRLIPLDQTQIPTVVQGTIGYLDPEYLLTNQLTAKSDVYSFGVVLLELITGRRAVSPGPEEDRSLVMLSISMIEKGNFFLLVDECIGVDRNIEQIMDVTRIAKWCVKMKGDERPDMKVVSMELESLRLGRKPSLVEVEKNDIEVHAWLSEGFDGILSNNDGSNATTSSRYGSLVDQVAQPMREGR